MPRKKKPRPSLKNPRLTEHERERSRDTVGRIVAPPPPPTKLKCPGPPATLTVRETRRLVREASEGPTKAPAPD
ncbi:hypothetical protein PPTG_22374 [Phytophthora nicotianae INRA-310]|uniref:Uncharacterized protein n=1 Tax=Phytophthora nicotianae (strain INRA-310) TaxID=761204 RepID=W2QM18_PHYN3|nr:hypothetical protein PPTG_22374 [Phytophthora nicotianae INRA-310]ETN13574.1 hypothetical protein PPTG_22374 [Phytophthora nicotianae INRA-310]